MKPPRDAKSLHEIRERILEASLGRVAAGGIDSLSMRALADQVGMTAPHIYNFFANKDEIVLTLMKRGFEDLNTALKKAGGKKRDPADRARAYLRAYLRFATTRKQEYELMFSPRMPKYESFSGTPNEQLSVEEHRLSMAMADLAAGAVKDIAKAWGIKASAAEVRHIVAGAWGLVHGLASLANSTNLQYLVEDPEAVFDTLVKIWAPHK